MEGIADELPLYKLMTFDIVAFELVAEGSDQRILAESSAYLIMKKLDVRCIERSHCFGSPMVKGLEQCRVQLAHLFCRVRVQIVGPQTVTDRFRQPPMFIL